MRVEHLVNLQMSLGLDRKVMRNARFGGLPVCYGWHGPEGAPCGLPWVTLAWGFGGLLLRQERHGPVGAPRGLPWVTPQDHCEKAWLIR